MKKLFIFLMLLFTSSAAFANAQVTQKEWRWRTDNGTEASAPWRAAQNVSDTITSCSPGDTLRLRIAFLVAPDPASPNDSASRPIQYNLSYSAFPSGPWTQITTSMNDFMLVSSSTVADNTPTTQQLVSSGTFAPGTVITAAHSASIIFHTPGGQSRLTEHEWVIMPTANVRSQTYYFSLQGLQAYNSPVPSLTIRTASASTQEVNACGSSSYVSPSGNYTWTTSGTYNDTIPNAIGCDSVITTVLSIGSASSSAFFISACDSYESPSGNYTWTASGTYNDTIPNMNGCDSVITVNLTINAAAVAVSVSTCNSSYSSPSGNQTWTSSGVYSDTLTTITGCDSVLTVTLSMNVATTSGISQTACTSYTSPSGNSTWTSSGTYLDTIPNIAGCDSVITINLVINTVNTATSVLNETITAAASGAMYQWVDCNNNNTPVAGATAQSFTATANGSYAVIVTENGCSEMSACTPISSVGLAEISGALVLSLYPNPNSGSFTLETSSEATVEISNAVGQMVMRKTLNAGTNTLVLEHAVDGMYFVSVIDAAGNKTVQRIAVTK